MIRNDILVSFVVKMNLYNEIILFSTRLPIVLNRKILKYEKSIDHSRTYFRYHFFEQLPYNPASYLY